MTVESCRPRLLALAATCTIAALAALAAIPSTAAGTVGNYQVTVSSTSSAWASHGSGARLVTRTNQVVANAGAISRGSWREWRLAVPNNSIYIRGGTVDISYSIPRPELRAQVRSGNLGGASRVHVSTRAGSSVQARLSADASWVGFGLVAVANLSPTTSGANQVSIRRAVLQMRDMQAPTLSVGGQSTPGSWRGPTCRTIRITGSDTGAGVSRIELHNLTTGRLLHRQVLSSSRPLQPGARSGSTQACVGEDQLRHGINQLEARVIDASGRDASERWTELADLTPPDVGGIFADGQAFVQPRPPVAFRVSDQGSGVATVSVEVNGVDVPLLVDGDRVELNWQAGLPVGRHRLVVRVTDRVGLQAVVERSFDVGDVEPPEVTVHEPGSRGSTSPRIRASASDAMSGVDPSSWQVLVNGELLRHDAAGDGIVAQAGMLTGGSHRIEVRVADHAGNRRVVRHAYQAVPPASMAAVATVGQATGLRIARWQGAPVIMGRHATATVVAARRGRPLGFHRILVHQAGRQVGSGITNVHGVAVLRWTVPGPGEVRLSAPGSGLGQVRRRIRARAAVQRPQVRSRARVGVAFPMQARISAGPGVRRVHVQARSGRTWYTVRRNVRVDRSGAIRVPLTAAVPGRLEVRVFVPAQAGWSQSAGPARAIRITR